MPLQFLDAPIPSCFSWHASREKLKVAKAVIQSITLFLCCCTAALESFHVRDQFYREMTSFFYIPLKKAINGSVIRNRRAACICQTGQVVSASTQTSDCSSHLGKKNNEDLTQNDLSTITVNELMLLFWTYSSCVSFMLPSLGSVLTCFTVKHTKTMFFISWLHCCM